jgi:hypothetical protein
MRCCFSSLACSLSLLSSIKAKAVEVVSRSTAKVAGAPDDACAALGEEASVRSWGGGGGGSGGGGGKEGRHRVCCRRPWRGRRRRLAGRDEQLFMPV